MINKDIQKITEAIQSMHQVIGIGQTSDPTISLQSNKTDIDLFILCNEVPVESERKKAYHYLESEIETLTMTCIDGGYWGVADLLIIQGVEIYAMYFNYTEMEEYLSKTLSGCFLDRDGDFYPTGRIESIRKMYLLYEAKPSFSKLKTMIENVDIQIFHTLFEHHIRQVIDVEDLERVRSRKDIFFYHIVLDNALDHYFQSLYALNQCFFPSRKRNMEHIQSFHIKPYDIQNKLNQLIKSSVQESKLDESIDLLIQIYEETEKLTQ